jgi:hypothetical protein
MVKNKKAFTLFSTLVLLFVFSLLVIKIFETKSIASQNIINEYKYIQAKNHLIFLEEYIKTIANLDTVETLKIEDDNFDILTKIKKLSTKYEINLYVKSLNSNVRLHKKIYRQF